MNNLPLLRNVITGTTLVTALIHLVLAGIQLSMGMMGGVMFIANGLGYLALLVGLLYVKGPQLVGRERLVHYVYLGFTAVTVIAYFAVQGAAAFANPLGLLDKVVEVVLLGALWQHLQVTNPA